MFLNGAMSFSLLLESKLSFKAMYRTPLRRKVKFRIITCHDIISAKPGKIFGQDQIDFSAFDIDKHALKSRAFKIETGITVINIYIVNVIAALLAVRRQDRPLASVLSRRNLSYVRQIAEHRG